MISQAAIFLDKDGTLVPDVPYNVSPERIDLAPGAEVGLPLLRDAGYCFVLVSNQSGIARGYFAEEALIGVRRRIEDLLGRVGVELAGFYYCPHYPTGSVTKYARTCDCRKPLPGMILRAASDLNIDLSRSWIFGDILDDVEAGHRAGCRSLLVLNGGETEWKFSVDRVPDEVAIDLEEAARRVCSIKTEETRTRVVPASAG